MKEYWIIDRFRRIMTVYRKGLVSPTYGIVIGAQTRETGILPGFVLPLSRLLAQADSWTRAGRESKNKPNPPSGGTDG